MLLELPCGAPYEYMLANKCVFINSETQENSQVMELDFLLVKYANIKTG